jgi:hypothetical protein
MRKYAAGNWKMNTTFGRRKKPFGSKMVVKDEVTGCQCNGSS